MRSAGTTPPPPLHERAQDGHLGRRQPRGSGWPAHLATLAVQRQRWRLRDRRRGGNSTAQRRKRPRKAPGAKPAGRHRHRGQQVRGQRAVQPRRTLRQHQHHRQRPLRGMPHAVDRAPQRNAVATGVDHAHLRARDGAADLGRDARHVTGPTDLMAGATHRRCEGVAPHGLLRDDQCAHRFPFTLLIPLTRPTLTASPPLARSSGGRGPRPPATRPRSPAPVIGRSRRRRMAYRVQAVPRRSWCGAVLLSPPPACRSQAVDRMFSRTNVLPVTSPTS